MASKTEVAKAAPPKEPANEMVVAANQSLMTRVALRYGVEPEKMNSALKATAFRQRPTKDESGKYLPPVEVSNEQMLMLMVIADQYKLNPFTREIYAFPSENGIVAIVSVDGWIRIINERPELSSITFELSPPGGDDPWISCTIERSDRTKPVTVTEWLAECSRDTRPWASHPRRMLRHKALIQCARVAFGFGGIFDPDEGDRVVSIVEQGSSSARIGKPLTKEPQRKSANTPMPEASAGWISLDQATILADKIKEEGVDVTRVLAEFTIGDIGEIQRDDYQRAIELIDKLSQENGK
jgi:phage recombination protein Bet